MKTRHALSFFSAVIVLLTLGQASEALAQDAPADASGSTDAPAALKDHPARTIAMAYGADHWDQVARINFNFNSGGKEHPNTRQWTWWPKTGKVKLTRADGTTVTYTRPGHAPAGDTKLEGDLLKADRRFVNDSYWLLFPFQIDWSNPTVSYAGRAPEDGLNKVMVEYPAEGGYTPGDTYELYVDDRAMVHRWVFVRGDKRRPISWEGNRMLGPITVSTQHRNAKGEIRLWFDGLELETTDGRVHHPTEMPSDEQG